MKFSNFNAHDKVIFTGLFNACANGPIEEKSYCLELAQKLWKEIKENQIPLTPINYHAMIKGLTFIYVFLPNYSTLVQYCITL